MVPSPFTKVGGVRPRRNIFDLSYRKLLTADMGELIPIQCDEAIPGDVWKIGVEVLARAQPMVVPIYHDIDVTTHTFFVPYRILFDGWEKFITGGPDGRDDTQLPRWPVRRDNRATSPTSQVYNLDSTLLNSLWDYMGFPIDIARAADSGIPPAQLLPLDFPRRAYNLVWFEYYRDQFYQSDPQGYVTDKRDPAYWPLAPIILGVPIPPEGSSFPNDRILYRNWTKDYFTSSMPEQQLGIPPALPIEGLIDIQRKANSALIYPLAAIGVTGGQVTPNPLYATFPNSNGTNVPSQFPAFSDLFTSSATGLPSQVYQVGIDTSRSGDFLQADLSKGSLSFNVSDMRRLFQIQLWQERNQRAGVRYTEFLRSHYGVSPRDDRLDRPEYIGGTRNRLQVSEVLQTSSTDTTSPQGNYAGHGLHASGNFVGKYSVKEFGLILTLLSIMPKPMYQDTLNRQWTRSSRFDFYSPEFAHLSEQAILNHEIRYIGTRTSGQNNYDLSPFGFQGIFDEMRIKYDQVVGEMRVPGNPDANPAQFESLSYWHLARHWNPATGSPSTRPIMNESFIQCKPDKRIFAVRNRKGFIVSANNLIRAARPLPLMPNPGLIDHTRGGR